jgi:MFS family permease
MDETVNNGAQTLYLKRFDITPKRFSSSQVDNLTGLIVGAPYLACALLGCWLTEPLNRYFARRGTIFISCFIAAIASIWEGVANSWVNLFIARFVLGLGIGSKSSTVPVYSAECSPAPIRGALVMMVITSSPLCIKILLMTFPVANVDSFRNYAWKYHGRCLR